jgi:simple sugar transport system ATP-binding protein
LSTLALEGIGKSFGPVCAVLGASVEFASGGIHAVVGENGAGKSTLLKIAAGILSPDAGQVRIDGRVLEPHTAAEAIGRGVAMVQQHFALIGTFTVLENLVLGAEPTRGVLGRIDLDAARDSAKRAMSDLGVELPLDAYVEDLGVGERQRIEIARALLRRARVLILDEPTAVLTPGEATALYATLRRLADAGRAIVVVTHKLDEVTAHADRVTVMRKGKVVEADVVEKGSAGGAARLARAIMGGEPPPPVHRHPALPGPPRLVLRNVSLGRALSDVSFEVRAGEVVGIAGVEGNGQRELVRILAGLDAPTRGSVEGAGDASVVHEDRQTEGLVLDASVGDNLVLGELARYTRLGLLNQSAIAVDARARADRFDVVPRDLELFARVLSGGNQQKIVVARAIARGRPVLVVAHPTRGVDLGATRAIHAQLLEAARAGAALLVVSADLQELRALSDRILVMARGSIVAELAPTSSDEEIGARMIGAGREGAPPTLASASVP